MKPTFNLIFISIATIITSVKSYNYCDPELCDDHDGNFYSHIACNHTGEFSTLCSSDAKIIPMTDELITLILKTTNQMRNKIASGYINSYEPAARMPTIIWDDELAHLAELNVKQCEKQNDQCHNTKKCQYAGQIADTTYTNDPVTNPNDEIIGILHSWFNQYQHGNELTIFQYVEPENQKTSYKAFTQLINQKVNKIGCAISTFTTGKDEKKLNTMLMTCNFSYMNVENEPVYKIGEPCSQCKLGCNTIYKSLCDIHEIVKNVPDRYL